MARKMKSSGIEWIGDIPEDWEVVKIKILGNARNGLAYSNSDLCDKDEGTLVLRASNIIEGKLTFRDNVYVNKNIPADLMIKDGDILICSTNGSKELVGKNVIIRDVEASFGAFMMVLRCDNPEIMYYILNSSLFDYYKGSFSTTTINQLTKSNFANMKIPWTRNPKERESITTFLDKKSLTIEKIKNAIIKELQTLEDYKKSVITEAVTKGLDKNAAMKDSGIEWIGEIPKHWEVIKLKYEAEKIAKGISPKYVEEELTPVINQATFSKGYFDNNLNYCSDKPIGDGLLQKNDVLLATTGGGVLGKCFFFEEDGKYLASTDVAFIRCKDKAVAKFIYYIFSVSYQLFNGIYAKGATNQTHLQMNMLSNMQLPLPSDKELEDIILFLDKMSGKIDDAIAGKQKQLETLEEYKKSLIYEYVTGKKEVAEC